MSQSKEKGKIFFTSNMDGYVITCYFCEILLPFLCSFFHLLCALQLLQVLEFVTKFFRFLNSTAGIDSVFNNIWLLNSMPSLQFVGLCFLENVYNVAVVNKLHVSGRHFIFLIFSLLICCQSKFSCILTFESCRSL